MQTINPDGLALLKGFEGFRSQAYQDVAGVWTIGYGHTRGVYPGMMISMADAELVLRDDLHQAEYVVNAAIGDDPTTSDQFSAMVSLCYNIGGANFRLSTVLAQHCAGLFQAAGDAFLLWNKSHIDGKLTVIEGLVNRRTAERALYLRP